MLSLSEEAFLSGFWGNNSWGLVFVSHNKRFSVPELVVNSRAVEQGREEELLRTHAAQHQADAVQRRQQEEDKSEQEAAVVGLPHTAIYPALAQTGADARTHKHKKTKTLYWDSRVTKQHTNRNTQ